MSVVDDFLHLHFERMFQGKIFSDVGQMSQYGESIKRPGCYVEIDSLILYSLKNVRIQVCTARFLCLFRNECKGRLGQ
jgi:hypothetical protein